MMIILSNYFKSNFFLIWSIILFSFIFYFSFKYNSKKMISSSFPRENYPKKPENVIEFNITNLILIGVFLVYLCFYIYLILYQEDFAWGDNNHFTHFSLIGKNYAPPIWPFSGRFFPLGHQEFNLIRFFSKSPTGYHGFPIFQLLIVMTGIWIVLNNLPVWFRLLIMTLVMSTTSFVMSFFGLVYTERNVIFWLIILLVCFQYFLKTGSRFYFCSVLIATQFALYYKEPVFVLIGSFATIPIVFHALSKKSLVRQKKYREFCQTHLLEIAQIILIIFFLLYFTISILPQTTFGYATSKSIGTYSALISYLQIDFWLTAFVITLFSRSFYLVLTKKSPDLFWDSLAIGAFFYFLAYVKLQMFEKYFMAPVDFVAILYLGQLIYPWFSEHKKVLSGITATIIGLIACHNIVYSSFHIIERKNLIQGKVQLSRFVKDYAEQNNIRNVNLFFPYSKDYHLMLISTFMEYKGLNLPNNQPLEQDEVTVTLKSPYIYPKNNCIKSPPFGRCFHAQTPNLEDLIVVLADDAVSAQELVKLKQQQNIVFHYQPRIPISPKIFSVFKKFPKISKISQFEPIEDNLLHIYVFQKPF